MILKDLKRLKSGTDVRGTAVETDVPVTLTNEAVDCICKAFIKWLGVKTGKAKLKIALGNDSRISAERIVTCAKNAMLSCGADVVYTGLSSTPSMFILLKKSDFKCDASIMVTASHLPYNRNGLKFFTEDGGLDGNELDEILELAAEGNFTQGEGKYEEKSFMDEYSRLLVNIVERECGILPLKGKKIIVDAGNGAGGFFAEKVLKPLGADTRGSQFLEPDGYFPNHIPNPEDKQAIDSLSQAVIREKADFGIIFDTDVDRAACVDEKGGEINRNALIALLSAILLKDKKGVIVTDSVTSDGLTEFIKNLGGEHLRYKRGYKYVIDKCKEINANGGYSPLAIETSGHAAFKENYYLDDGAYLITQILISLSRQAKDGKSLTELIKDLKRPVEESEVRITFNDTSADYKSEGKKVIEELKQSAASQGFSVAPDNYEGVRMNTGCGWVLVRMSVHDPVMPINLESDTEGGNRKAALKLLKLLEAYPFLNTSNLKNFTL
ncbi:MAG: phosphomannomutase/phosphoglucomutase [Clostridia bacterium]|nr:phosphomannomutase/phosphoglucomutase [Clostridia bacterium]